MMEFEKVKKIIVDTLAIEEEKVTMEASLKDDLGIDSLDSVELSMNLEDEFSIQIEEEKLAEFVTVGDIVNYLASLS
ncbi:MAG: acyl carrier protein [Lachnospiraceae bacterium]|nr:acyl carrier protein [Lachnospiraceae bacterium]